MQNARYAQACRPDHATVGHNHDCKRLQARPSGKLNENTVSEFSRVIGRRQVPDLGGLRAPTADERAWAARMAPAQTRVPKGIFRYTSHRDASAEWERWQAAAVTAATKA